MKLSSQTIEPLCFKLSNYKISSRTSEFILENHALMIKKRTIITKMISSTAKYVQENQT